MASPAARVLSAVSAERKSACPFNKRRTFFSIVLYAPEVKMGDFISYVSRGLCMELDFQIMRIEVTNPFFLHAFADSKYFAPKKRRPNILEYFCQAPPVRPAWRLNKHKSHSIRSLKNSGQVFLPPLRLFPIQETGRTQNRLRANWRESILQSVFQASVSDGRCFPALTKTARSNPSKDLMDALAGNRLREFLPSLWVSRFPCKAR